MAIDIPPWKNWPQRRKRRSLVLIIFVLLVFLWSYYQDSIFSAIPIHFDLERVIDTHTITVTRTVVAKETKTVTEHVTLTPAELTPSPLPPSESHTFLENGLLEVNPNGRHPIYDLIERAEADWNAKLAKQSKTLQEAVEEYERRYKRAPPIGFDDWWDFCQRNNVPLPDEYDRIHRDLEPFWGIDPVDLNRLVELKSNERDSYTIGHTSSSTPLSILKTALQPEGPNSPTKGHLGQAQEMIDTVKEIEEFIPPFQAVFSPHDNPYSPIDWEIKSKALEAAANKEYININIIPTTQNLGWKSACSPSSSARSTALSPPSFFYPKDKNKTFIYDHLSSMDPCRHPTHLNTHGQFLFDSGNDGIGPSPKLPMVPSFSYSSTSMHYDILPAVPINWVDDVEKDPEFAEKDDDRLYWRGSTTGMWMSEERPLWRYSHRLRFIGLANERSENVSVLSNNKTREEQVGEGRLWKQSRLNPSMMDSAFAGFPHSCAEEACKEVEEKFVFRKPEGQAETGKYKYLFDIDGNGWSARYKRLIVSNSVVFKSTIYGEWFQDRIQPWVHYVPIQVDLSDLYDSLMFFRGDLNGDGAHEELAGKIAKAGRDWAKTHWRRIDMTAYNFRLFLEYSRVMSLDREAASYKPRERKTQQPL